MKTIHPSQIDISKVRIFFPSHYHLHVMRVSKPETYSNEYGEGTYKLQSGDAKLEGTRGEHWSPDWGKIVKKYLTTTGEKIVPDALPYDVWVEIQTHPDREVRQKSLVWAMPASLVSSEPFQVGKLIIDPAVDMLCIGGDETGPNLDWGMWPVKRLIFVDTYED